jgi:Leucine-rich repeat (LRR) protein
MKPFLLLIILSLLTLNTYAQNVYIPDVTFKSQLLNSSAININLDTEIQVSEAEIFAGQINCWGLAIADLTGIEAFTSVSGLKCSNNQLTSLDLSQNIALTFLECDENQLTTLDLTQNSALVHLSCNDNLLTDLDLTQNSSLVNLHCNFNELTDLDLTQNSALVNLYCNFNQLTSLDVSHINPLKWLQVAGNQITALDVSFNYSLIWLYCYANQLECLKLRNGQLQTFITQGNPNLTCIEVTDSVWSEANWTAASFNIDASMFFSLECNNTCYSTLNLNELSSTPKKLLKIVDLMGKETPYKPNTVLIYVYDDGSIEKVYKIE